MDIEGLKAMGVKVVVIDADGPNALAEALEQMFGKQDADPTPCTDPECKGCRLKAAGYTAKQIDRAEAGMKAIRELAREDVGLAGLLSAASQTGSLGATKALLALARYGAAVHQGLAEMDVKTGGQLGLEAHLKDSDLATFLGEIERLEQREKKQEARVLAERTP